MVACFVQAKDKARSYREELHAFMQQHREKIENIAQTEMQIADLSSEVCVSPHLFECVRAGVELPCPLPECVCRVHAARRDQGKDDALSEIVSEESQTVREGPR